jgi:hypothetical protein
VDQAGSNAPESTLPSNGAEKTEENKYKINKNGVQDDLVLHKCARHHHHHRQISLK